MSIVEIKNIDEKECIGRYILENLSQWFEIKESRDKYIEDLEDQLFLAYFHGSDPLGFIALKKTGDRTLEISVMGVIKNMHRQGIGSKLLKASMNLAKDRGFLFLQVKTLKSGLDDGYDKTNLFYRSMGFSEFELIEDLWGKDNPCLIYILGL